MKTSRDTIEPYCTKDGSLIRELIHPENHGNHNLSLAEAIIAPGSATKLHVHDKTEELYHVIKGRGIMTLGSEQFAIKEGDTICIRPGQSHKVENTGNSSMKILCSCAPAYSHNDTRILDQMK